jgi:hypothetical protein
MRRGSYSQPQPTSTPETTPGGEAPSDSSNSAMASIRPLLRMTTWSEILPRRFRLAHEAVVVTEDRPHPAAGVRLPPRANDRRSRRPCHPHAISSGHQRYPADTRGHSKQAVGLGVGP